jgi:hypothetical protein
VGSAYTPGLAALEHAVVLKERRLPLKGRALVGVGDMVRPDTVVASAERPGDIETIRVAEELDCEVDEAVAAMKVKEGDSVAEGDALAEYSFLWGLFSAHCRAPFAGKVEYVSQPTGHIGLRRPSTTIDLRAYVPGRVVEVFEGEGVRIETRGALVQGIFGIGGEATGRLAVMAGSPGDVLTPEKLASDCSGRIIVAGMTASSSATCARTSDTSSAWPSRATRTCPSPSW